MFDALTVKNDCVNWIREFFEKNGKECNAVVGISGGKDSSIVAALCVEALGKDRVIGVLMPCGEQHDIALLICVYCPNMLCFLFVAECQLPILCIDLYRFALVYAAGKQLL